MSNKQIQFKAVYNRKNELDEYGKALLQIEAYKDSKRAYFSTGIHLKPQQWDKAKAEVTRQHPDHHNLNIKVKQIIREYQDIEFEKSRTNNNFSLTDLKKALENKELTSFTDFAFDYLKKEKQLAPATRSKMLNTLKEFAEFNGGSVKFSELSNKLIDDFRLYLSSTDRSPNTQKSYFKHLSKYVKIAVKQGLIEYSKNPLLNFTIKAETPNREYLNETELKQIEDLVFSQEDKFIEVVRDLFLLECYTGLRFSDASILSKKHIKETKDGLELNMFSQKEKKKINLPLYLLFKTKDSEFSKPERLLKKYWRVDDKPFFLAESARDSLSANNQHTNRILKRIQAMAGISPKLTNHVGRHTFATYFVWRVPLPIVQELLQHSKIETTMGYVGVSNDRIKQELKKINY